VMKFFYLHQQRFISPTQNSNLSSSCWSSHRSTKLSMHSLSPSLREFQLPIFPQIHTSLSLSPRVSRTSFFPFTNTKRRWIWFFSRDFQLHRTGTTKVCIFRCKSELSTERGAASELLGGGGRGKNKERQKKKGDNVVWWNEHNPTFFSHQIRTDNITAIPWSLLCNSSKSNHVWDSRRWWWWLWWSLWGCNPWSKVACASMASSLLILEEA
jgi:hypothetical protein